MRGHSAPMTARTAHTRSAIDSQLTAKQSTHDPKEPQALTDT
jgi:hypothetical protein